MSAIDHVVVAIPARDEESLLPACLRSVSAAVSALRDVRPGIHLVVAVTLDGCTDGSARVLGDWDAATVELPGRGVGAARDAAIERGLSALREPPEDATWVACTDADTVVPSRWLVRHVMWAERGADLVVGTAEPVGVARGEALAAWHARHQLVEGHTHVHGANLGVRADAYLAVGGWPALTSGEDNGLWDAVRATGLPVVSTRTVHVVTSSRTITRATGGFGQWLVELADAG